MERLAAVGGRTKVDSKRVECLGAVLGEAVLAACVEELSVVIDGALLLESFGFHGFIQRNPMAIALGVHQHAVTAEEDR